MKSTLILTLILLVAAFAVAQDQTPPSAPPVPGSSAQSQSQNPSQAPDTPAMPAARGDIIEGCLGGSSPNYTVTDKAGTTYNLLTPPGADVSVLAQHIGESVQVEGTVDRAGSKPSDSSATPDTGSVAGSSTSKSAEPAATTKSIQVMRIGKGTSTCPAVGGSATKPPSK